MNSVRSTAVTTDSHSRNPRTAPLSQRFALPAQNRLYAALGVRITENSSLQLGYLKNHFRQTNFDRLQVAFFYNPDLRGLFKKK